MTTQAIDERSLSELLSEGTTLKKIEPCIYSVMRDVGLTDPFEKHAAFYDRVICNPLYNRLVWGYSVKSYESLARNALTSSRDGWVLDAGCGSLAFTAKTYLTNTGRPVVLLDRSLGLLRIAKARLARLGGDVPPNMVFLLCDAMELPFKPKAFKTVIAMNLLHVLGDAKVALLGLRGVLADGGAMTLSTLVENNRFSDGYLRYILPKTSGVAPRKADDLPDIFADIGLPARFKIKGNMAFIYHNI